MGKTNGNDAAFCGYSAGEVWWGQDGLTKREYFAAMAMQGLLARGEIADKRAIAENAVRNADYLIEALNKEAST